MFNFVNNFFKSAEQQAVESSNSSSDGNQKKEQEQKKETKKYLEQEEQDEVKIGGRPELTEEEVYSLMLDYISKLINSNADNPKIVTKLEKFRDKFDVKRFMKNNPHMTYPDFYMVIYNETEPLLK